MSNRATLALFALLTTLLAASALAVLFSMIVDNPYTDWSYIAGSGECLVAVDGKGTCLAVGSILGNVAMLVGASAIVSSVLTIIINFAAKRLKAARS